MSKPLPPSKPLRRFVARREFVAGIAAASVFSIVPRRVLGGPGHVPPSERINIGCIGVGGQGTEDMQQFLANPRAQVVAVCDVRRSCDYSAFYFGGVKGREPAKELVNATYAKRDGVEKYAGCEAFIDFGEMLEEADVDAVSIGTPDHLHAIPAMAAMRRGKHVYCQKPLTYTVREARALADAAKEHGVVTQMGNQGHASDRLKQLVELLKAGAIGHTREIHCWAAATFGGVHRPKDAPLVPEGLHWDKWIGPAPYRPYHPAYTPFEWRSWRDFGTGNLGDLGCHIMDPATWAFGFPKTMTIESSSSPLNEDSWAAANTVRYRFNAPEMGPMTLTWYDGGLKPFRPAAMAESGELPDSGGLYIGDDGIIVTAHGGDTQLFRKGRRADMDHPKPVIPRGENHYEEWVRACKGGAAPLSNFAYAGPLTEMVLMGNVGIQTGKRIEWDSERFEVTNLPDANRLLHREYREGWTL